LASLQQCSQPDGKLLKRRSIFGLGKHAHRASANLAKIGLVAPLVAALLLGSFLGMTLAAGVMEVVHGRQPHLVNFYLQYAAPTPFLAAALAVANRLRIKQGVLISGIFLFWIAYFTCAGISTEGPLLVIGQFPVILAVGLITVGAYRLLGHRWVPQEPEPNPRAMSKGRIWSCPVKKQIADIIVTVHLFSTEAGGRRGPTPDEKFSCLMAIDAKNFDVRLHLDGIGSISPGQTAIVPVSFLDPEHAKTYCSVGQKFLLKEIGAIGDGVINEII
jgi:hypothetical protein